MILSEVLNYLGDNPQKENKALSLILNAFDLVEFLKYKVQGVFVQLIIGLDQTNREFLLQYSGCKIHMCEGA